MDTRSEIREFLTSRRAKLKAADVGLPDYGTRRVPGLRREEVAVLAGVSVPYYTRLERGDLAGASDSVLEALARALQLDDAERAYLFDLARAAQPIGLPPRRRPTKHRIRPSVQQLLDAISGAAAHIGNDRLDIIAANPLGRALFLEMFRRPGEPERRALRLSRPARPRLLPRLGPHRARRRRHPTLRRRPQPLRPRPHRPRRRTINPQRRVPPALGKARRPLPHQRASSSSTTARSATSSSTTNAWKSSSTRA
jgi:transcriptional regulator with XRE-family HTH domain